MESHAPRPQENDRLPGHLRVRDLLGAAGGQHLGLCAQERPGRRRLLRDHGPRLGVPADAGAEVDGEEVGGASGCRLPGGTRPMPTPMTMAARTPTMITARTIHFLS